MVIIESVHLKTKFYDYANMTSVFFPAEIVTNENVVKTSTYGLIYLRVLTLHQTTTLKDYVISGEFGIPRILSKSCVTFQFANFREKDNVLENDW